MAYDVSTAVSTEGYYWLKDRTNTLAFLLYLYLASDWLTLLL